MSLDNILNFNNINLSINNNKNATISLDQQGDLNISMTIKNNELISMIGKYGDSNIIINFRNKINNNLIQETLKDDLNISNFNFTISLTSDQKKEIVLKFIYCLSLFILNLTYIQTNSNPFTPFMVRKLVNNNIIESLQAGINQKTVYYLLPIMNVVNNFKDIGSVLYSLYLIKPYFLNLLNMNILPVIDGVQEFRIEGIIQALFGVSHFFPDQLKSFIQDKQNLLINFQSRLNNISQEKIDNFKSELDKFSLNEQEIINLSRNSEAQFQSTIQKINNKYLNDTQEKYNTVFEEIDRCCAYLKDYKCECLYRNDNTLIDEIKRLENKINAQNNNNNNNNNNNKILTDINNRLNKLENNNSNNNLYDDNNKLLNEINNRLNKLENNSNNNNNKLLNEINNRLNKLENNKNSNNNLYDVNNRLNKLENNNNNLYDLNNRLNKLENNIKLLEKNNSFIDNDIEIENTTLNHIYKSIRDLKKKVDRC